MISFFFVLYLEACVTSVSCSEVRVLFFSHTKVKEVAVKLSEEEERNDGHLLACPTVFSRNASKTLIHTASIFKKQTETVNRPASFFAISYCLTFVLRTVLSEKKLTSFLRWIPEHPPPSLSSVAEVVHPLGLLLICHGSFIWQSNPISHLMGLCMNLMYIQYSSTQQMVRTMPQFALSPRWKNHSGEVKIHWTFDNFESNFCSSKHTTWCFSNHWHK